MKKKRKNQQVDYAPVPYREELVSPMNEVSMDGFNFKIFPAIGGMVVEVVNHRKYNATTEYKEPSSAKLYVINEKDDFTDRISKIITMALLENRK